MGTSLNHQNPNNESWLNFAAIASLQDFFTFLYSLLPFLSLIVLVHKIIKFSGISFSKMYAVAIFIILITSYTMTYNDCMNDLKADNAVFISKTNYDPCKSYQTESPFTAFIFGSYEEECKKYNKKILNLSKNYCNTGDVLIILLARIPFKFFGAIINEYFEFLDKSFASCNFISRWILKFISTIVFGLISVFFGLLIFFRNAPISAYFNISSYGRRLNDTYASRDRKNEEFLAGKEKELKKKAERKKGQS